MYIDTASVKSKGKTYTRYLLRTSYREDGKVKHKTIANLSSCSPDELEAIRLALKHKKDIGQLIEQDAIVTVKQGPSIGALLVLKSMADEIGLSSILDTQEGKLALWQIFARIIDQGSRLSSVRLAQQHAVATVLGIDRFNENDLYDNLDWLAEEQDNIEEALFKNLGTSSNQLFLYDVTSSYLEGEKNELAEFGYNRDKKKGKPQIVIGLLCNNDGIPITVKVFKGNMPDQKTIDGLIQETAHRFGVTNVVWVGDRGMIKSGQIDTLKNHGFHYITAITKAQIKTLIKSDVIQLGLFDSELTEVVADGVRYILRKNPVRKDEIEKHREAKLKKVLAKVTQLNEYLSEHPRAQVETAIKNIQRKIENLGLGAWVAIQVDNRILSIAIDKEAQREVSQLDGCYVLKTDISSDLVPKEVIHDRYKDLALVEQAFRTCKTGFLELRPVYVRKETRTKGHVFVVMLAYRLVQHLSKHWKSFNMEVAEGIDSLGRLCLSEIQVNGKAREMRLPEPTKLMEQLLNAAGVNLLTKISYTKQSIATKKRLDRTKKKGKIGDLVATKNGGALSSV